MPSSEGAQAGPSTSLETLKAFKDAQERRVAHWQEYDEAIRHYEATPQLQNQNSTQNETGDTSNPSNGCSGSHNHYDSGPQPISDELMGKILSLVTSGLLDCSHAVRAVETELRSTFEREDLAKLVGRVQDLENAVLRAIVARDQCKRRAKLEDRDLDQDIEENERTVKEKREEIVEVMMEINAEMAEL